EWTRKLVHFGGGLIAASFPWLFTTHWTVLALGSAFFLILWATRRVGLLQSVHGVARRSEGGLYYPVAVYLLFLIAAQRPVFYLIAILALVLSDTVAAVLGSQYGRVNYTVEQDRRTLEGSAVFFVSTFLVVHLPLLLLGNVPPALSVLVAFQIALLMTLFEGISLRGNDNLVVPLMTYFLLLKLTTQEPGFLAYQIAAQLVIMTLVALVAWRYQFLTASGAMGFMLFFYGAYSLGGEEWTVAPAVALVAYTAFYLVRCRPQGEADPRYQVVAAFYVSIVPGLLYIANNTFEKVVRVPGFGEGDPFYAAFLGAVAAQVALVVYHTDPSVARADLRAGLVRLGAPVAAFLLIVPLGLLVGTNRGTSSFVAAGSIVVLAVLVHALARRLLPLERLRARDGGPWMLRVQTVSVALATALVLPWAVRA
ncbi:MAG: hypothetical protein H0X64_08615, partial [Gemmatimonadaceae bacterium]|nr:hypothetical protein [Gemmatimonadaceae bacterium]